MRKRTVLNVVGALTALTGLTMLFPAAVAAGFYRETASVQIAAAGVLSMATGFAVNRWAGPVAEITIREGFAIVTLGWLLVGAFGSLPYLLTGSIPSVPGAFFETISGLTTTGASVVVDIDALPRGIVLWRSQTQWLGGMGIIVLSVAILPLLGVGGMQLMQAEIPGLSTDRLRPRVRHTATLLWGVYALFTVTEGLLLWAFGMTPFQALNHALTTMATGGFSTEDSSIAGFDASVQYVIMVFVFLAGINFTLHYSWLTGRWGAVRRNQELRVYAIITMVATSALTLLVWLPGTVDGFEESFRAGLFQATSIMTTTGYANADYELWMPAAQVVIFLLMLIGGCTGSTAGSIKVLRHMIVAKEAQFSMRRLLHPRGVFVYKIEGKPVASDTLASVSGFLLLYLLTFAAGIFVLALLGLDSLTALGAAATTLGNVGPGFGIVGPTETFASLPAAALWVLSGLMLLGRLELYTVLILLTRGYWRR
ncbi:MAG TPA: TrkH family potassium uptake protein [Gemmatimonadota bacterium]|nr:TrkH family potassium uptake protein [Gemmatimonadota bacterium]